MKKKTTPKAEPTVFSAEKLAAKFRHVPPRTLATILTAAGVAHHKGQGFDQDEAAAAVILHFKSKSESADKEADDDRRRKAKSEANITQLEEAEKIHSLVSVAEGERCWSEAVIKFREGVRKAKGLTPAQKQQVCAILAGVKLERP